MVWRARLHRRPCRQYELRASLALRSMDRVALRHHPRRAHVRWPRRAHHRSDHRIAAELMMSLLFAILLLALSATPAAAQRFVSIAFHDVQDDPRELGSDDILTARLVAFLD